LAVHNRYKARLHAHVGILGSSIAIESGNDANITVCMNKTNHSAKRHLPN
jgi:hypothetical protein